MICTGLKTNEFYTRIKPWPKRICDDNLHGSLSDVFGVGLLFVGRAVSQVGVCARSGRARTPIGGRRPGHREAARRRSAHRPGTSCSVTTWNSRRGLVDIPSIFGIRAVRQQKRIEVVVQLEEWNQDLSVDRTGLDAESTTILDVELPKVRVPLNPGKNITVVAEVIAMNHLLKYSGIDPAERFNERLMRQMRNPRDVSRYLQEDNE